MCLGVPGRIIEVVDEANRLALADFGGVRRKVNVICVLDEGRTPNELIGAWVLVHVGFAMSVIDERQAAETLEILSQLGEAQDELAAMRERSASLVGGLIAADLDRAGQHPAVGRLRVRDLLQEWVHHDRNHVRQALANVQAYVWPAMGNAQRFSGE